MVATLGRQGFPTQYTTDDHTSQYPNQETASVETVKTLDSEAELNDGDVMAAFHPRDKLQGKPSLACTYGHNYSIRSSFN